MAGEGSRNHFDSSDWKWMVVGKLALAVVHIDFIDSYMVKFVPDLDSNIIIDHQESQGAPLKFYQTSLGQGSACRGVCLKSAAVG